MSSLAAYNVKDFIFNLFSILNNGCNSTRYVSSKTISLVRLGSACMLDRGEYYAVGVLASKDG